MHLEYQEQIIFPKIIRIQSLPIRRNWIMQNWTFPPQAILLRTYLDCLVKGTFGNKDITNAEYLQNGWDPLLYSQRNYLKIRIPMMMVYVMVMHCVYF